MNISGYAFEGPYSLNTTTFNHVGAVYVISDDTNAPLDVGQTSDLSVRIGAHEREDCWQRNASGQIVVYAFVEADERSRLAVEAAVRGNYKFTCGVF